MLFPNFVCVDNFFDDPEKIINLANEFEYFNALYSPGKRTDFLHNLNFDFFKWVNFKIGAVLYPSEAYNLNIKAETFFQKTNKLEHDNWVHLDDSFRFTAIIYLNKNNTAGTSIFKRNHFKMKEEQELKYKYFKNEEKKFTEDELKDIEKAKESNNSCFSKTLHAEGIYNRLILFDGNTPHASNPMESEEERLTLISFIKDINLGDKKIDFPVTKMRTF